VSAQPATSSKESNTRSAHLVGPGTPVRLVAMIVGVVVGLTFLFAFGNVATLGIRLGVSTYVAFLVAPAVDLSVVALLVGTRHLILHGGPAGAVRSARRLLIFASMVTLALNVAEPLIAGDYGKAAFDAVGPLLLIGFSSALGLSPLNSVGSGRVSFRAMSERSGVMPVMARGRPGSGAVSTALSGRWVGGWAGGALCRRGLPRRRGSGGSRRVGRRAGRSRGF